VANDLDELTRTVGVGSAASMARVLVEYGAERRAIAEEDRQINELRDRLQNAACFDVGVFGFDSAGMPRESTYTPRGGSAVPLRFELAIGRKAQETLWHRGSPPGVFNAALEPVAKVLKAELLDWLARRDFANAQRLEAWRARDLVAEVTAAGRKEQL